jgi:hypothetical protein
MTTFANRVRVSTATTGTGTVTLGSATSNAYATFAEAGVANASTVTYLIEDVFTDSVPRDFEIGTGVYTSSGTTLTRATVLLSKINGTSGTTKITLSGSAVVSVVASAEDLTAFIENVVEDTSPQLGADLDANAFDIQFDDATGVRDDSDNEQLIFQKTASAVNYVEITNNATGAYPIISANGDDTNVGLAFDVKGSPNVDYTAVKFDIGPGDNPSFTIEGSNAGVYAPGLDIYHNSATPAANDFLGRIAFVGNTTLPDRRGYSYIHGVARVVTDGAHTGGLYLSTYNNNSEVIQLSLSDGVSLGSPAYSYYAGPGTGNLGFVDGNGIYLHDGSTFPAAWVPAITFDHVASAVNYLSVTPATTGNYPTISAAGSDTNVGLNFAVKGDPSAAVTFDVGGNADPQFVILTDNGGVLGAGLSLHSYSPTPATNDIVGTVYFTGKDSGGNNTNYASLRATILDTTNGSEDGSLALLTNAGGSSFTEQLYASDGVTIGGAPTTAPGNGNLAFGSEKSIKDTNGNELIKFPATVASAVNEITVTNAAAFNYPQISASGSDSNIGLIFNVKGDPDVTVNGSSGVDVAFNLGDGSSDASPQFQIASANAGSLGPQFNLLHYSGSQAADDTTRINFQAKDSAGNVHGYTQILSTVLDTTNASEDGRLDFLASVAGSLAVKLRVHDGVIIGTGTTFPGAGNLRVGTIELGADTDTTLSRTAAGELSVEGVPVTMTGKKTMWIPAGSMQSRTTSGSENTTREINSITTGVQKFDTAADEGVNFNVAFPKAWNAGTVTFQAVWTAASGSGTVEFELRGGCFANDAAINVTGLGTAVASTDTLLAADDVHVSPESSAITLTNAADDCLTYFELIRDVSDDTLGVDAELIGIKLYYTTNAGNDA